MKFRDAQDSGLLRLFSQCACGNAVHFVPVLPNSNYRMKQNKTLIMTLNLAISASARVHAQLSNLHRTITLMEPKGGKC